MAIRYPLPPPSQYWLYSNWYWLLIIMSNKCIYQYIVYNSFFFHLWYNQKQVSSSHSCIITLCCTFLEDHAPFIRIMEYFRLFFSKFDAYLLFGQWHFDIDISFHRRPHNTFELLKLPGLEIGKLEQSRINFFTWKYW